MKIDKYEKMNKGKYRLYLDNGEIIDTYDDVILENNLLIKKELNLDTYNKVLVDSKIQEKYNACVKYITVRVRSKKEIEDYLKRNNVDNKDYSIIINKLIKNKMLNDDYFTKCFISDKLRFTSWGPYKIKNELKKHNIDSGILNKYNYLFSDDDIMYKLTKLIDKQINSNRKLDNNKLRGKLYNSFFKMGYESDMILNVLNERL